MTALTLLKRTRQFFEADPARFLPEMLTVQDAGGTAVPACAATAARWSLYGALVKHAIEGIANADTRMAVVAQAEAALDLAAMGADARCASFMDFGPRHSAAEVIAVLQDAERLEVMRCSNSMASMMTLVRIPPAVPSGIGSSPR